jgi:tetratricopeptide (TPR) repeat protein
MKISFLFLMLLFATVSWSQSNHKNLREGDKNYYQQEYLKAEENYRKALEKDAASINGNHNLGNALYNQERFEEAAKYYESAALQAKDKNEKSMSYHNLGNSYLSQLTGVGNPEQAQELLNKSVEAYKQSLKLNPKDEATKYNLAYAQKLQQEMAKQPQQPQPQKDNQDNPPPQSQDNPSEDDNNKEKQPPKDEPKPDEPQQKSNENMTKEEAERLIKIMEEEERKVQERMNKKGQKANPSRKDW